MCRRVRCRVCDKATWAGCGQHAEQVLAGVPRDARCTCTDADRAAARGDSLLSRLFRR
jgi:hypothetical protein